MPSLPEMIIRPVLEPVIGAITDGLSATLGSALHSILGIGGAPYAIWDFTKTDRLFQDSTGSVSADSPADPVGLWLDSHGQANRTLAEVLAAQPELRLNPANAPVDLTGVTPAGGSSTTTLVDDGSPADNGKAYKVDNSGGAGNVFLFFPCGPGVVLNGRTYALEAYVRTGSGTYGDTMGFSSGQSDLRNLTEDYRRIVAIMQATADDQNFFIRISAGRTNYVAVNSIKEVPAAFGVQPSGALKGILQPAGIKYDGNDDYHLTNWTAQGANNCIIAQVTVPVSLSSSQMIAGASDSFRFYLGINPYGFLFGGVGDQSGAVIVGNTDLRGMRVVVGLSLDGDTVRLFHGDTLAYEAAQSGPATTATPICLGATNAGGVASNFFAGPVERLAAGTVPLTLSQFLAIQAQWLND